MPFDEGFQVALQQGELRDRLRQLSGIRPAAAVKDGGGVTAPVGFRTFDSRIDLP